MTNAAIKTPKQDVIRGETCTYRPIARAMGGRFPDHESQRGAALIVGLVLMMVLTILAISTMRTATLELAMAGNSQYAQQAEQLAAAGLNDGRERMERNLIDPVIAPTGLPTWTQGFSRTVMSPDGTTEVGRYDVLISHVGRGFAPYNYDSDTEVNFFEISSTGRTTARNASATQVQGFFMPIGSSGS